MEEEKRASQNQEESGYTAVDQAPLQAPWVERNGFSHWAVAFAWVFIGLFAFQILGGIVSVILIIPTLENFSDPQVVIEALTQNVSIQLQANSIGQFLIIGLASYLISKAHTVRGKHHEFLRLKSSPNLVRNTLLSIVLLVSSWGVVGLLGWLNINFFEWLVSIFPKLSFFQDLQDQMLEIITGFIKSDNALIYGLIYIALVPAIFEEIMFRGYIQGALEKSWGIWPAIIVSSLLFGAYHLQPSNILPLAFIGFILAFVTYISDSLIPAMILHFINNGSQVVYGSLNPEFLEMSTSSDVPMPWFLIILSVIVTTALLLLMHRMKTKPDV